jgi:hypothetical protein
MNNVLWGDGPFGYYETVCGGAAPGRVGRRRRRARAHDQHPHHRPGGGGAPLPGARGALRRPPRLGRRGPLARRRRRRARARFLAPVSLSVLTQHRVERPYGVEGGEAGEPGSSGWCAPTVRCSPWRPSTAATSSPATGWCWRRPAAAGGVRPSAETVRLRAAVIRSGRHRYVVRFPAAWRRACCSGKTCDEGARAYGSAAAAVRPSSAVTIGSVQAAESGRGGEGVPSALASLASARRRVRTSSAARMTSASASGAT